MKTINLSNTDVRILMNDTIDNMETEEVKDAIIDCVKSGFIYDIIDDFCANYITTIVEFTIFNNEDNIDNHKLEGFTAFKAFDDVYVALDTSEAYDHSLSMLIDKADIEDLKDIIDNVEILESGKRKILKEIELREKH